MARARDDEVDASVHDLTDGERAQLDALIPRPWSARHRWLVIGTIVLAIAGAILGVRSGVFGPQLSVSLPGGGVDASDPGRLEVEWIVLLRNDGWVRAEVEALAPPDLAAVTWRGADGLPVVLDPGEEREVVVNLDVAGCEVDLRGYDDVPVRASGGLLPSRTVEIAAGTRHDPNQRVVYQDEDGAPDVILPAWPDQAPSWILDAIHAPCASLPDRDAP